MRGNQKNVRYIPLWSREMGYAIGLITTDGSLSIDGRHIIFTSKDLQLIETLKSCLRVDTRIRCKKSGFNSTASCSYIEFSNVRLYQFLMTLGLMPNKTKQLGVIKVPDRYFFDFLRGHLDGDGYFYSFWDTRWRRSFMFYTNFLSASYRHIRWIRENIKRLLDIQGSLRKEKAVWQLRYAKRESSLLLRRMYRQKNIPCLLRKRQKIERALSINGRVLELVDRHG